MPPSHVGPLIAAHFEDYQLLDSGAGRKLERLCGRLLDRPCPQAIWPRRLPSARWQEARSVHIRSKKGGGHWKHLGTQPPKSQTLVWQGLRFEVRFTDFGHVGLFLEQAAVWSWLERRVAQHPGRPRVLNLFAYTGAASLVMARAGAHVTHLDAIKSVVRWARASFGLNGLPENQVAFMVEDARKYLKKCRRRGTRFDGLLLDPPSWGHGPKGEIWQFDDEIAALIDDCLAVLAPEDSFLFLTCHTPGVQAEALRNLVPSDRFAQLQVGDVLVAHRDDRRLLPAGIYLCADSREATEES